MRIGGAGGLEKNDKLQNLLSESILMGHSSYEDELEHLEAFERQEMSQRTSKRRNELLRSKEMENKREDDSPVIGRIEVFD